MSEKKRRVKTRGNGTGTAFKRGSTWTAQVVVGWREIAEDKPLAAITRSKGGFRTRDEALRYCPILKAGPQKPKMAPTLEHYWDTYTDTAFLDLGPSKQQAYRIAWNRLADIQRTGIDQLMVSDLQGLIDKECTSYHTAKDCKTLLVNLFRIAAAEGYVRQELPSFIRLPALEEEERTPFSEPVSPGACLRSSNISSVYKLSAYSIKSFTSECPTASEKAAFSRISISHGISLSSSNAARSRYLPIPYLFSFFSGSIFMQ